MYSTARAPFLRAHSGESTQRITYEEGGEGSGPSVDAEMVCEICKSPERADVMILCDGCTDEIGRAHV